VSKGNGKGEGKSNGKGKGEGNGNGKGNGKGKGQCGGLSTALRFGRDDGSFGEGGGGGWGFGAAGGGVVRLALANCCLEVVMKTLTALVLVGVVGSMGAARGFAQAGQSDSQTLQAILVEMRAMHDDVRLSQMTQILLTELEVQQTTVNRSMQKRDDAKNRISQVQDNEKNIAEQMTRFEEAATTALDPQQKDRMKQMQDQMKSTLANLKTQEPERANDLLDAETALRKEQDTLAGIQDQLNEVVKKLQPAGRR
jgi:hypothetical protein